MNAEKAYLNEINRLTNENNQLQTAKSSIESQYGQLSSYVNKPDSNMMEYQLDLKQDLDLIYHLLSGHEIKVDSKGNEVWGEPEDDRLKVFSDYGVKQIIKFVTMYINKNTLLSYYDDKQINWKLEDFGEALSDFILERYEDLFYYPNPEDLYEKAIEVVDTLGYEMTKKELYFKCIEWSELELKKKIPFYYPMVLNILNMIHSTYQRSYGGKERESMRKSAMIHENVTTNADQKMKMTKPSTW